MAAPPAGPQGWQPDTSPAGRKSKRRIILWSSVVAAVALLAGGAAVAVSLINDSRDPAAQVEQYLDLLASGKAEEASKLVKPGVADDSMLTDEVLEGADERIKVVSVETTERSGDSAKVTARLSLAGEEFDREFTVDQGPKEMLVLQTWELNESLVVEATIQVNAQPEAVQGSAVVQVAGVELVLADIMKGENTKTFDVYPGVYEVTAGDFGTYLQVKTESDTLIASPIQAVPFVSFMTEYSSAYSDEILKQAAEYADGCVLVGGNDVVKSNMDTRCPLLTQNKRLAEMKVSKYPQVMSGLGADWFETDLYEFEVRGTASGARPAQTESTLAGEITWKNGEPSISDASFSWW